ncbi:MAG: phosphohydrolase [Flammeovirgaceae bacterium]|nr:phosphohydrolase [Flammeovirgaceae bacterium]MBR11473.1 phosphohydrolase [Rickettsiales bacterium]HCX22115.1 phosphohydrolase [Cytophagales bacterium]
MTHEQIIQATITYVQTELAEAEGGHDWWHIERVWKLSKKLAAKESVNLLIVELGALLHDIADSKFHGGDESIGPRKAKEFMQSLELDNGIIEHVVNIIEHISFKGGNQVQAFKSPELDVVQDADRLDAIGAIGIARAFNYGGFKNRELYNPSVPPNLHMTKEEYKKSTAPTINHFYEKLLLLKDRMNTETGKELAKRRHIFMEEFLQQFYDDWEGQ